MENSAVEWQFEQFFNSFEKFNNGEYTFNEYLKRNLEIREQAKEMEKEQIKNSYHSGTIDGFNFRTTSISPNPEQYYNETFKSE